MYTLYVILNYISVFVMIACVVLVATHESSRMQKLALMVCVLLLVSCIGFLIKSEAQTADALIVGQKLVYATVTHGMLLMLLFILEYCRFNIPKAVQWIGHGVNLLITVIVLTLDHHDLFYVSYWAEDLGGHVELMKEYGPAHTLAVGVFGLYMAAALAAAIVFSVKNMRERSRYVWRLLIAVSLPCIAYVLPKLTGTNNELQPVAFAMFTLMLIGMVYQSKLYDVKNIAAEYSVQSVQDALVVFGSGYSYKGCNDAALRLFPFLTGTKADRDIRADSSVLRDGLDGVITEYTQDDKIYAVSVRPVREGEIEIGRVLWFKDVTIERNYTKLLQEQKQDLESRVETLFDYSYKDDLTGLGNRRYYEDVTSELREREDISDVIVAELDLNGLKAANDTISHKAGDELLIGTAAVLNEVFAKYGKVFRTGGDEFFVIISGVEADVDAMTEELTAAMQRWHGKQVDKLSLAYGFARAADHPEMNIDELMLTADKAMYRCKAAYYSRAGMDRRH